MSRDVLYFLYEAPPTPKKKKGGGELIESEYWPRKEKKKKERKKTEWISLTAREKETRMSGEGERGPKKELDSGRGKNPETADRSQERMYCG